MQMTKNKSDCPLARVEFKVKSTTSRLCYANQINVPKDKLNEAPYSMDANLLHTSYEGKILEDLG